MNTVKEEIKRMVERYRDKKYEEREEKGNDAQRWSTFFCRRQHLMIFSSLRNISQLNLSKIK